MEFFKIRKMRKELKELLNHAKHVRNMQEDIAAPELIALLISAEKRAKDARVSGQGMESASDALEQICLKVAPPRKRAKTRENVEVLFVSIAAAMAIRAYFFQPFKIPTGSMQPTLYGITEKDEPTLKGNNPLVTVANRVLFGERNFKVRAKVSGPLRLTSDRRMIYTEQNKSQSKIIFFINDVPHKVPTSLWRQRGEAFISLAIKDHLYFNKGDVLFEGVVVKSGDYILVNRLKYNFIRPKRGDITVFDTCDLTHPQVRNNAYYIKRMVGLPNETISVAPPYLLVNGEKPADPRFEKIFTQDDYSGYQFGSAASDPLLIGGPGESIVLGKDEYLFFGDNTDYSLDARYFGGVKRKRILGPAFFVCWPLDRAGFAEISH